MLLTESARSLKCAAIFAMKIIFRTSIVLLLVILYLIPANAQTPSWSERMASTAMTRWANSWETDPARTEKWSYEQGVLLKGIENVWLNRADGKYFTFIQRSIDRFVNDNARSKPTSWTTTTSIISTKENFC